MNYMTRMLPIFDLLLAAHVPGVFYSESSNGFEQWVSAQAGLTTTT